MTINKGLFLFDFPEPTINAWENQLGYRGMLEVWQRGSDEIRIIPCDDSSDWEVLFENDRIWEFIGVGSFEQADAIAKEYMQSH